MRVSRSLRPHEILYAPHSSKVQIFWTHIQCPYVDELFQIGVTRFVWDADKAVSNAEKHGVTFETAAEVLLDPLVRLEDATSGDEERLAAIGVTLNREVLYVIHIEIHYDLVRIISARLATKREVTQYEDHE